MIAALCGEQSVKERISLHGFYLGEQMVALLLTLY
jgi:hypothetical protein